ncbi:hypothetical protein ColLi_09455 [Colletotrichum liriopes]|uniref:PXA domain-containing protein n=1 Tax=Colletotrichum liriopes TaxID=708192 RepID=A0AA37GTD6_9PEZI|nr:hypothetical protein ColLi_09455 [Colletotrichum liriopes]
MVAPHPTRSCVLYGAANLYLGGRGLGLRWRSGPASKTAAAAFGENEADGPSKVDDGGKEAGANANSDDGNISDRNGEDDGQQQMLSEIEEGILDVFSDEYCNKHLVYSILELILVRLMPELAEKGVVELWEERLSL